MKFLTRLRFLFGIIMVIVAVGLLVLYLNNAMSTVHTSKAELGSDTTTVGTDYPGLVTKQYVSEGDKVKKGQVLFVVTSPQLVSNLADRSVLASTLPYKVDAKTGDIFLKANDDGVVQKVSYLAGSYVPVGAVLATLDTVGTSYIVGHFHLTPPDYARVKKGNTMNITFPDNTSGTASVYSITLTRGGTGVDTVVKARLQGKGTAAVNFPVGTPVDASLKLTHRTWYQDVSDFVRNLFKPAAA